MLSVLLPLGAMWQAPAAPPTPPARLPDAVMVWFEPGSDAFRLGGDAELAGFVRSVTRQHGQRAGAKLCALNLPGEDAALDERRLVRVEALLRNGGGSSSGSRRRCGLRIGGGG